MIKEITVCATTSELNKQLSGVSEKYQHDILTKEIAMRSFYHEQAEKLGLKVFVGVVTSKCGFKMDCAIVEIASSIEEATEKFEQRLAMEHYDLSVFEDITETPTQPEETKQPVVLHKTVLKDGYYEDGMSVKLMELNNGWYGVYYYIHCEDRHSEYGQYNSYSEALNAYENVIVTYC